MNTTGCMVGSVRHYLREFLHPLFCCLRQCWNKWMARTKMSTKWQEAGPNYDRLTMTPNRLSNGTFYRPSNSSFSHFDADWRKSLGIGMSNTRLWDLNDLITRHHQCRSIPLHKRSISIPRTEQGHIVDDKLVPIFETVFSILMAATKYS